MKQRREVHLILTVIPNNNSTLTDDEVMTEIRNQLMNSDQFKGGSIQLADKLEGQVA